MQLKNTKSELKNKIYRGFKSRPHQVEEKISKQRDGKVEFIQSERGKREEGKKEKGREGKGRKE